MKKLLTSSVLVLSLSGCLMPSGINPTLGCGPLTGCTEKDYYLPGKGVWAPKRKFGNKATIGAVGGTIIGAAIGSGGDPLTAAAFAVGGLVIGHEVGATLDKIDEMYATQVLLTSLATNGNGQTSTWKNPDKGIVVTATPHTTNGNCREFETTVNVQGTQRGMRGSACKEKGEWVLREVY